MQEHFAKKPRLVIAGTHSGVGKTTVMVGLSEALVAAGMEVSGFKCGPDYLDPTYHARATRRICHNLDGWLMGKEAACDTLFVGSEGTDISLIEGVMGLYDGAGPKTQAGSAAEIAKWLQAPVVLVVDASGMARSARALVDGFLGFDKDVNFGGVIFNRVGSQRHLELLKEALGDLPVLGGLPKVLEGQFPQRHLGLKAASLGYVKEDVFQKWRDLACEWFDLEALKRLAHAAAPLRRPSRASLVVEEKCRLAVARDEVFSFYYEDNLARLKAMGASLVPFSPLKDDALPEGVHGVYLGGGYPETKALQLMNNASMRQSFRDFAARGGPIYGECGGMMYLCEQIVTKEGAFKMLGLLKGSCVMGDKLAALGYVEVETQRPSVLGRAGLRFRGHQFRYSHLESKDGFSEEVYKLHRRRDRKTLEEGYGHRSVLGSYVHAHWASNPEVCRGFVESCVSFKESAH